VGTIIGIVEKGKILDARGGGGKKGAIPGDVLLGLPSAGLHTNGYSLARKVFFDRLGLETSSHVPELGGTVGEVLLAEHRSYLAPLRDPLEWGGIKGLAHITGGGITDNLPRVLPDGCAARVRRGSWPVPPVFELIGREGAVPEDEMFRTFNMGIGMILIAAPEDVAQFEEHLARCGQPAHRIGEIVSGERRVEYV
jgi:phosphoribosylformylglycinamidine cyclo-ligase